MTWKTGQRASLIILHTYVNLEHRTLFSYYNPMWWQGLLHTHIGVLTNASKSRILFLVLLFLTRMPVWLFPNTYLKRCMMALEVYFPKGDMSCKQVELWLVLVPYRCHLDYCTLFLHYIFRFLINLLFSRLSKTWCIQFTVCLSVPWAIWQRNDNWTMFDGLNARSILFIFQ